MNWTQPIRDALLRHHRDPGDDVVEELAQHAASAFEAARADGATAEEADARVRALIDSWCAGAPRHPRTRRPPIVEAPSSVSHGWTGAAQDLRYGLRLLRRQPGFALIAALLIALGVGATTTLVNLSYHVLLKPMPWPDAGRLVRLAEAREGAMRQFPGIVTNGTYLAWRDRPSTIGALAGWNAGVMTITGDSAPARVRTVAATASLFDVLQSRPMLGAPYTSDDERPGRPGIVVLSYSLWQQRFGGRPDAIGRSIEFDGKPYRVAGVMSPEFAFPTRDVQAWMPLYVRPVVGADAQSRSVSLLRGIARLAPGATAEEASAEATARGRSAPDLGMVGMAMFGTEGKPRVTATSYLESLTADVRPALEILIAAVVLLFVAAIANVAGMQLARATARRREVAVRSALGAGPGRLARQLFTENLIIGVAGGLIGWALAFGLGKALPVVLPTDFPRLDDVASDWRVPVFAIAIAVAASLAFGALPALIARRLNLVQTLVEDSLAPIGGGVRSGVGRLRVAIMSGQVAVAAMLLVGAAILGRSFLAQLKVDRGYEPHNLLTATLPMPDRGFTGLARVQVLDTIVERLERVPGVVAAAGASLMPLLPFDQLMSFTLPRPGHDQVPVHASLRAVGLGYFRAMGMHLVDGRGFAPTDTLKSQTVLVVNRTFARTYLDDHAVGRELPISFNARPRGTVLNAPPEERLLIVGVVDDVKQGGVTDPVQPEIYTAYRQNDAGIAMDTPVIVARTSGDPTELAGTLRRLVQDARPSLALDSVMTMDDRLLASLARPRLYAIVLGVFAGLALTVAAAGLFGVLSYTVAQRSREIGVRAALGARPMAIVALVVRQGVGITIAGAALGLAAAYLLAQTAGSLLFGVTAHDPWSFGVVPIALIVVGVAACLAPARRAAKIDPLRAMRGT